MSKAKKSQTSGKGGPINQHKKMAMGGSAEKVSALASPPKKKGKFKY